MEDIIIPVIAYSPVILLLAIAVLALGNHLSSQWSARAPTRLAALHGVRTAIMMLVAFAIVAAILAILVLSFAIYFDLQRPQVRMAPLMVPMMR